MDYQDFAMRKNLSTFVAPDVPRSLEWVWQGSKTFGSQYQVKINGSAQHGLVWQLPPLMTLCF